MLLDLVHGGVAGASRRRTGSPTCWPRRAPAPRCGQPGAQERPRPAVGAGRVDVARSRTSIARPAARGRAGCQRAAGTGPRAGRRPADGQARPSGRQPRVPAEAPASRHDHPSTRAHRRAAGVRGLTLERRPGAGADDRRAARPPGGDRRSARPRRRGRSTRKAGAELMPAARAAAGRLAAPGWSRSPRAGRSWTWHRAAGRCGSAGRADRGRRSRRRSVCRRRARAAGSIRWSTNRRSARAVSVRCTPGDGQHLLGDPPEVVGVAWPPPRPAGRRRPDRPVTSSTSGMCGQRVADVGQAALHHGARSRRRPAGSRAPPAAPGGRTGRARRWSPAGPAGPGRCCGPARAAGTAPSRWRADPRPGPAAAARRWRRRLGHVAQSDMRGRPSTWASCAIPFEGSCADRSGVVLLATGVSCHDV